jgi:hypothetical protein
MGPHRYKLGDSAIRASLDGFAAGAIVSVSGITVGVKQINLKQIS